YPIFASPLKPAALTGRMPSSSEGPLPVGVLSAVDTELVRVVYASDHPVDQGFAGARPGDVETRHPVYGIDGQAEAVGLVSDRQLQGSVDIALFLVAADVDVVLAGPPIREPMNEERIGVEIEDHRLVRGKESLEFPVRHAVRMLVVRDQPEQVHHVYESHLDAGQML